MPGEARGVRESVCAHVCIPGPVDAGEQKSGLHKRENQIPQSKARRHKISPEAGPCGPVQCALGNNDRSSAVIEQAQFALTKTIIKAVKYFPCVWHESHARHRQQQRQHVSEQGRGVIEIR